MVMDELGRDLQDHRRLPFAGVTHVGLLQAWVKFLRFGTEQPIRSEQQQKIRAASILLALLENCLPARHVVSPMPVDDHNAAKPLVNEVLEQVSKNIEISAGRSGQSSGKIQVMIGVPEPEHRGKKRAIFYDFSSPLDDLTQKHTICKYREMLSVLLESTDRNDDRHIFIQPLNVRGFHLC